MTTGQARTTDGHGRVYETVLDTIGNTPCIRVNNLAPDHVDLYVKGEFFNPAGSVKDRLAVSIIEEAERSGALSPGQTVVEATSGNTGIGLAMVCAAKGYPLVVTMADSFSIERRRLMRFFGAKVVLTPRAEKGYGMYYKAKELADANGWFLARQFETEANAKIHENTTAREILADFEGKRLDYWVTGYGTGGTITGAARVLRKKLPNLKIILSEPANAQLLGSGHAQERSADGEPAVSHPAFEPHPIQGWTPDFIPLRFPDRSVSNGRKSSRKRKVFSWAYPAARPSPSLCKSRKGPNPARSSCACCLIRASGISPHHFSRPSKR
jgi:cysteine synthase A